MNGAECALALEALAQACEEQPLSAVVAGQYKRLFAGYSTDVAGSVIDDLVRLGIRKRPAPAELGEMLRTKMGVGPAGSRVRRDGPYLTDLVDPEKPNGDLTPPESFPDIVAQLRDPASELRQGAM